jgi:hypothetical protein
MPDSEETKGYAGFAFLLHPPLWCGDEPAERTKEALTESIWRSRLQIGVEISVTREGLVLIGFGGWHETSKAEAVRDNDVDAMVEMDERRVAVGNAFLACLHTALLAEQKMGHRAQVITPAEVVHVTDIGLPDGTARFFAGRPLTALVSAALDGAALDDENPRMLIVERATLDVASGLLDELLGRRGIDGARTAALLLRAAKAAEDEEYGLALIIAWSLLEQMLNACWVKYLERQGASKARIKKLQERDWTASVVTEALSIAKELSDEQYTELNALRRARNRWAHELRPITEDEAHRAVKLAGSMLMSVGGSRRPPGHRHRGDHLDRARPPSAHDVRHSRLSSSERPGRLVARAPT